MKTKGAPSKASHAHGTGFTGSCEVQLYIQSLQWRVGSYVLP